MISHAILKRKQALQQRQTHQSKNQNYRQINAIMGEEKKEIIQKKFDQICNVQYHNRKDQEMTKKLPPAVNNAIARKKRKKESGLLY